MNLKHYRAVFYSGDASIHSHDFYVPADTNFNESCILLELMDAKEDLQDKYGCRVSFRVYFVAEEPASEFRRRWRLAQLVRRFSSFFGL